MMSSDSSDYGTSSAKVYKLKSRKTFPAWKQKTLSLAKSKGYERFLLSEVPIKTEVELEAEETTYLGLTDAGARAIKKRENQEVEKGKRFKYNSSRSIDNEREVKGFKDSKQMQRRSKSNDGCTD